MKILYLLYHGFSSESGISKKIHFQIKALKDLGHHVDICTYIVNPKNRHRQRLINEEIIEDYGTGKWAAIKRKISYDSTYLFAVKQQIDVVYVRSFNNANPFTVRLFRKLKKAGIRIVMEIPTYPYDAEYVGFPLITRMGLFIDKLYRHSLASHTKAIVTFSDYKYIFGQRTIRISNGVNFESIPLKKHINNSNSELHLIGVAEVHYWHGFDRLIEGLGKYYKYPQNINVYFHIVGGVGPSEMYDSIHAPGFDGLIRKYKIEKYVIFHNTKFGEELDNLFEQADFGVGSLARHRSYIDKIKTLKNREYAARGIPFIYSETDDDFEKMPYIIKAPADESPINIHEIIKFYQDFKMSPETVRNSIRHLSWKEQMDQVIKQL